MMINFRKNKKNNLEKLIFASNNKISFHSKPKTIYLENFDIHDEYDKILSFLKKFEYSSKNDKVKKLKRGFLFEMIKNTQSYIIKYQPNKSFSEIIMNKYLSKYNHLKNYLLYPDYIFINKNNSYFYIIQKYNCDLFQFMKKRKNCLKDTQIIQIIQFLITIIYQLHTINIIYGDIKLENIIINHDSNKIKDIKLIDFDVSLFDEIPNEFNQFDPKILALFENKKPRGTKIYMCSNKTMSKGNDIYSIGVFIIIFLYKNVMKMLHENEETISDSLLVKIFNKLIFYKNKLEDDEYKLKLIKYIFRIYNDRRFKHYWKHEISMKKIYTHVKKCIRQEINSYELYHEFVKQFV